MSFDPYAYDLAHPITPPPPPAGGQALAAKSLLAVPEAARRWLWRGLLEAVDGALDLWERTPPGQRQPSPFSVQHAGAPSFDPAALRQQTLSDWHRLVGIELRLAAQLLEALLANAEPEEYWARLAEQCARVGQLYAELLRRTQAWAAEALLRWELRLLRYRASSVLAPLIYG
jgi:hypothetical protein